MNIYASLMNKLFLKKYTKKNELYLVCKHCQKDHTIPFDENKHLPNCPSCGYTEWIYNPNQVDDLRARMK